MPPFLILLFLFSPILGWAVESVDTRGLTQPGAPSTSWTGSSTGYLRMGTAVNSKGGHQTCFTNPGALGNPLRLGNECGSYGELGLRLQSPSDQVGLPISVQGRMAFNQMGLNQWEDSDNDGRDINVVEVFTSARLSHDRLVWVGKRFYRDVDAYINDWFYFVDMSGIGAGLTDIPAFGGKLAIAHLLQASDTETDVGRPLYQVMDVRIKDLVVSQSHSVLLWAALGYVPQSTSDLGVKYVRRSGGLLGAKFRGSWGESWNDVALIYGRGILESLNIWGDILVEQAEGARNQDQRLRLVDNLFWHLGSRWQVMAVAGYENRHNHVLLATTDYFTLGSRLIHQLSDQSSLAMEAGWNKVGRREFWRVAIAPQWSLGRGVWARPVLRVFAAYSGWNSENLGSVGEGTPFESAIEGANFGYQFEFWF